MNLNNVTLVSVTSVEIEKTLFALLQGDTINFNKRLLISPLGLELDEFPEVEYIKTDFEIHNIFDYSYFIMNHLNSYINTEYALICQWDGHIINPSSWDNEFLNYDYIGAPIVKPNEVTQIMDYTVGNGGFSLRSKKLLTLMQKSNFKKYHPEDEAICIDYRNYLEEQGVKYAPLSVSRQFSFEDEYVPNTFGFHRGFPLIKRGILPPKSKEQKQPNLEAIW